MGGARGRRPNTVRIIAGEWRGRRLHFPGAAGLRPTSDRRRETLFNWLAPRLPNSRCLDLFAGSGALGFEAISRGADRAVLVDASREVASALAESRLALGAQARAQVVHAEASRYLARKPEPFDVVFLDPPFDRPALATDACDRLEAGWLAPGAHVYLEAPSRSARPAVPERWSLLRELDAGDVRASLFTVGGAS